MKASHILQLIMFSIVKLLSPIHLKRLIPNYFLHPVTDNLKQFECRCIFSLAKYGNYNQNTSVNK